MNIGADAECWPWIAGKNQYGYGRVRVGAGMRMAHREAYRYRYGEIPEGLQIDHLCRRRECCNPLHLEAVDQRTNVLRGEGPTAVNARRATCSHGHLLDKANTYPRRDGGRGCRACNSHAVSEYKNRKREGLQVSTEEDPA